MTIQTRLRMTWGIPLLIFVLWYGSYAYLYLFEQGGFKPLDSDLALFAVALVFATSAGSSRHALALFNSRLRAFLWWLILFLVYLAFDFLISTQDEIATQALISLVESVLLVSAFALLMAAPSGLRTASFGFALLALVGTAVNLYDFAKPTFSLVPGRAAGLYENPNIAGNFLAMAAIAGFNAVPRRLAPLYMLICGVGVLVTFSREAWVIFTLAIALLAWQGGFDGGRRHISRTVLALTIGGILSVALFSGQLGTFVGGSSIGSYLDANTSARLGIGGSIVAGDSALERSALVSDSFEEISAAPLFGHGLGYTDEWRYRVGPHNMYLLFLVEGGLVGLAIYLGLLVLLWRGSIGVGWIVAVQLVISSFFTHNHLGAPAILLLIAFVFVHGAVTRRERHFDCQRRSLPASPLRMQRVRPSL